MVGFSKFNLLLVTGIIAYLTYTLSYICPISDTNAFPSSPSSSTTKLSPILHHTCELSHQYLKPVFQSSILPNYQHYIEPTLHQLDESFKIHDNFHKVTSSVEDLSEQLELSQKFQLLVDHTQSAISWIDDYVSTVIYPGFVHGVSVSYDHLRFYYQVVSNQIQNGIAFIQVSIENSGVYQYIDDVLTQLKSIKFVVDLTESYNKFIQSLINTKSSFKFHEKSEFIKQEFKNLVKFNETRNKLKSSTKFKQTKRNIVELVKDILNKVSKEKKISVDKNIPEKEEQEAVVDDSVEDEDIYDYSEDEPVTVLLTSTVTVTNGELAATVAGEQQDETSIDPAIETINQELLRWEAKVNKTLQLARNNLEIEMEPIVNSTVETIKPLITEIFTKLHKDSHQNYQILHHKITEISKDYENIKESYDTTIESISRQEIRDDISETNELYKIATEEIQKLLVDNHERIVIEYFRVIQDTIDILESFSESTFKEFSNNLSNLIETLQESDSDVSWKFWKKFHKVKEEIFEFRDFIFDNAEQFNYNDGNVTTTFDDVIGLNDWSEFIKNIEFHINYINRDNEDYLRVVRAQANVAFQGREGLVRDLIELKAQREKEIERIEEAHKVAEAVSEAQNSAEESQETENVVEPEIEVASEDLNVAEDEQVQYEPEQQQDQQTEQQDEEEVLEDKDDEPELHGDVPIRDVEPAEEEEGPEVDDEEPELHGEVPIREEEEEEQEQEVDQEQDEQNEGSEYEETEGTEVEDDKSEEINSQEPEEPQND